MGGSIYVVRFAIERIGALDRAPIAIDARQGDFAMGTIREQSLIARHRFANQGEANDGNDVQHFEPLEMMQNY